MRGPMLTTRRGLVAGALGGAAAMSLPPTAAAAPDAPFTAAAVEGPFYLDAPLLRADLTEGRPGVPLEIVLVIRDETGAAFEGVRADVWHCDARGLYSGFAGQGDDRAVDTRGETFLRGTQIAGADGRVRFASVYPGWYPGRTAHVHFKIIDGTMTRLTSQFFLPDALSEYLYANLSAYRRDRLRDTLNATDRIALAAGETVHGEVKETARGYVASLIVTVDRRSVKSAEPNFGALPRGGPPSFGPFTAPPRHTPPEGAERVRKIVPEAG